MAVPTEALRASVPELPVPRTTQRCRALQATGAVLSPHAASKLSCWELQALWRRQDFQHEQSLSQAFCSLKESHRREDPAQGGQRWPRRSSTSSSDPRTVPLPEVPSGRQKHNKNYQISPFAEQWDLKIYVRRGITCRTGRGRGGGGEDHISHRCIFISRRLQKAAPALMWITQLLHRARLLPANVHLRWKGAFV